MNITQDIRWKPRFSNFSKSYLLLERTSHTHIKPLSEVKCAGLLKKKIGEGSLPMLTELYNLFLGLTNNE